MGLFREMKRYCSHALHQHVATGNDPVGNGGERTSSILDFTSVYSDRGQGKISRVYLLNNKMKVE